MKTKYSLLIAFISVVLALSVISCNNDATYDNTNNSVEYVELHIGQVGLASQGARYIDKVDFSEAYSDATFALSGTLKDSDTKFEDSYQGLAKLNDVSIKIQAGTWTFTLVAYNTVDGKLSDSILSATKTFEITSDTKELSFSLEFCEEQTLKGNLDYTITVPAVNTASMTVTLVMDGTEFDPKAGKVLSGYSNSLFAVDPTTYEHYSESATFDYLPLVVEGDFYQTTFTFDNLPVGTYQLFIVYTTDFMDDTLSQETMKSEQNIAIYPLVTRTGSTNIEKISKLYKIWYEDSVLKDDKITGNENLPNICANYQTVYLPALEKEHWTFGGWHYFDSDKKTVSLASSVDKEGNTVYVLPGSVLSEGFTLYPDWTEIPLGNFAVTFVSMDGSAVESQNVEENSCATKPKDPTRTGYTFGGWYTSSDFVGNAYDFATPVTADITLYAKWTINTYTISYSSDYGTAPATKTVEWGTKLSDDDLAGITAEGKVFKGWKIGDNTYATTGTTVTDNITLTADWSIAQITISYETTHGTAPETQTVDYGTVLDEYLTEIDADGYDFNGWFLEGKPAKAGTTLKANITLTASWTAQTYLITYYGVEDAENPNDIHKYTIKSGAITLAEPTLTGYTFKGWFTTETLDEDTKATGIAAGSTGDKEFWAKWEINSYTVSFVTNWAEWTKEAEQIEYKSTVTEPTKQREGYTLEGWYTDSSFKNKYNFDTPVTVALSLYANWTINTYTITYSSDYGTAPVAKTVNWGTKLSEDDLAKIEAEGWVFKGWKIGSTNTYATTDTTVTDNITLTADWSIAQITISYETTHGTAPETQTVDYGTILATAHLEEIEADGYDFNGWLLDGKEAEAGTTLKADITLTASWTAKTYSITYYGVEDAENPNNTVKYTIKSDPITLADASKEGYTFKGWFTTETFDEGTVATGIATGSTGNKTFYAKWEIKTFTITYTSKHGTAPDEETVDWKTLLGKEYFPSLVESGYKFNGWKLGEQTVTGGYEVTENIELVADWSLVEYKITLEGLEGADYSVPAEKYTVETETITLGQATKVGYDFGGWYTSSDFIEDTGVTEIETGSTGDKTFYAKWTVESYEVSFETGWDDWTIDNESIEYKNTVSEPEQSSEREGYTLDGWFTSSDYVGEAYNFETPVTGAIELFAKWTPEIYSITFEGLDGADYDAPAATYTIEDSIALGQPTKEGYDFGGWYTSSDFIEGTDVTEIATGSTGDKTFYAKWIIKTFEISYTSEHGTAPSVETVDWKTLLSEEYLPTLEVNGYTFNGWKLDGHTVTDGYEVTDDIELAADWSLTHYNIQYEGIDGTEYVAPTGEYTITDVTIPLGEASKDGYNFGGWYTSSDFKEGTDVTEIATGSTGNKTFYAKWTPITYHITYNLDGGENPAGAIESYTIEDEVTLPTPEKSGYTFLGWYDAETDGNKVETISIGSKEDKEYWAKWSQTFTITVEFESIPQVTAAGSWELVKESRTVHNDITDEDEQYDVFVAPEGWTTYTWYVDGVQVGVDSETPNEYRPSGSGGTHSLNCLIIRTVTGSDGEAKTETIYLTGHFTLTVQYVPMG